MGVSAQQDRDHPGQLLKGRERRRFRDPVSMFFLRREVVEGERGLFKACRVLGPFCPSVPLLVAATQLACRLGRLLVTLPSPA